ncbi:hypothetical protein IV500_04375 [Paeniglutamicibacter antarcticus]|uniref:Uncharacterized protein n=1 Tax=Arthrobacter terrae TaxID=2935737 RepID=A0A931G3G9_9MICC|nr:hypothetical protein [Arthrobacter terrae]MBG0738656.1 hypothetical protein [Arthrobacter terrae]
MTTTTLLDTPAVGARYRRHSTGRIWHVTRICDSGLIALTEDFYGCEARDYVSLTDFADAYEPAT